MMELGRSTVQVLGQHGRVAGAGFLVTEDLVVTSVHALIDPDPLSGPEISFELSGSSGAITVPPRIRTVQVAVPQLAGRVIGARVVDEHDLELADGCVLLRLQRIPKGLEPLRLSAGDRPVAGAAVLVAGFPGPVASSRDQTGVRLVRGALGPAGADGLIRIGGLDGVTGVWLGAPVLDEATGTVIGVVTRFSPHGGMGEPATVAAQPISVPAQPFPAAPHPWLRHHRVLLAGLAAVLAVAVVVVLGVLRPGAAAHDRTVSRHLSVVSNGLDSGDPMKSLLAAAALTYAPTQQALAAARGLLAQPSFALRAHSGTVDDVAYSPDGATLATAGTDGSVRLWDLRTHRQIGESIVESGAMQDIVTAVAFSPDGRAIATSQFSGPVTLRDLVSRDRIGSVITPRTSPGRTDQTLSLAFSPDGRTLATGGTQGAVRLWDVGSHRQTGNPLQDASFDSVQSIAFSPDGTTVATALSDGTARLWTVSTRRPGQQFRGHSEAVRGVSISPGGDLLATAGADGRTRLWDLPSGRPRATLQVRPGGVVHSGTAGSGAVNDVTFSPDGATVATAHSDGVVRLWSLDGSQRPAVLDGGSGQVMAVAFSPDGQQLATVGDRGAVRLWDVSPARGALAPGPSVPDAARQRTIVQALCETAGRPITAEEWRALLPDEPFRQICPGVPSESPN